MATTIKLKNSVTTTAAPSTLVQGEVATNITDKKVWVGDASSTPVQILGAGAPVAGTTGTFTGNTVISVTDNSNAALRITQLGTGNALLVEDSTNPDASPFVIDASGNLIQGSTVSYGAGTFTTPLVSINHGNGSTYSGIAVNAWGATGTTSPRITFARSAGSLGTYTSVSDGAALGGLYWNGADGTAFISAASILAQVDGTPGTNDMPGRLVFSTTADGASSPTERMRIGSDGSIGVGVTNAPTYTIRAGKNITGGTTGGNFYASGTAQSDVTGNSYGFLSEIKTAASSFVLGTAHGFRASQGTIGAGSSITNQYGFHADSSLTGATNNYGFYGNIASGTGRYNFYAAGTAANYFAGNVGINATAPAVNLEVAGETRLTRSGTPTQYVSYTGDSTGNRLTGVSASGNAKEFIISADTNSDLLRLKTVAAMPIVFMTTDTERMRITSAGNVGIGTSSPSALLDIRSSSDGAVGIFRRLGGTINPGITIVANETGNTVGFNTAYSTSSPSYTFSIGGTEKMRLDSSGNLGLGVTPSAWSGTGKAYQVARTSVYGDGSFTAFGSNWVSNSGDKYIASDYATQYYQLNGSHVWRTAPSGTAGNAITFTQAMTLDASGRLGIGTTSPAQSLHVNNTSASIVAQLQSGTGSVYLKLANSGNANGYIGYEGTGGTNMTFYTNDTERMRIDSSGNLLVGTASQYGGEKFNVTSSSSASSSRTVNIYNSSATSTTKVANRLIRLSANANGADNCIEFTDNVANNYYFGGNNGGAYVMANSNGVRLSNGGTSWASDSDERVKDIIEPITDAANKVSTLRAVIGKYKTDEEGTRRSFLIAQDVQAVLPEAVVAQQDEIGTLSLAYTDTIPLLVAAIQELKAEVDSLKAELNK
jgi:hypothetical protein